MKVLVTGISSRFGHLVAQELLQGDHQVLGVDRRPWPDAPAEVEMFRGDIRKRPVEDVFRTWKPEAVIHMATVTHLARRMRERYRINLGGTRAVVDHCQCYGVKQLLFVGRHTFYGADAESPLYHTEAEPPMAVTTFPELADLVAADLFAGTALWRVPELDTVVLRLAYVLGPARHGTLCSYLRGPRVPTVLGFDPLFQFLHERDAARALRLALEHRLRGVFNVAGPQPIPLSTLIRATGRRNVPVPQPLFHRVTGRFGLPHLPRGAVNHIKYPVVVDDGSFREATGYTPEYDEVQTMESFRVVADPF